MACIALTVFYIEVTISAKKILGPLHIAWPYINTLIVQPSKRQNIVVRATDCRLLLIEHVSLTPISRPNLVAVGRPVTKREAIARALSERPPPQDPHSPRTGNVRSAPRIKEAL